MHPTRHLSVACFPTKSIGQAQISLQELLLGPTENDVHTNTNTLHNGGNSRSRSSAGGRGNTNANRGQQQRQRQHQHHAQDNAQPPTTSNSNPPPTYYLSSNGTNSEPPTPTITIPHTPLSRLTPLARRMKASFSNLSTPSNATADKSPPGFSTPPEVRVAAVLPPAMAAGSGESGGSVGSGSGGSAAGGAGHDLSVDAGSPTSTFTSSEGMDDGEGGGGGRRFSFVAGESFKAGGSTVGSIRDGAEEGDVDDDGVDEPPTPNTRNRSSSSTSNNNSHGGKRQGFGHGHGHYAPRPSAVRVGGLLGVCGQR